MQIAEINEPVKVRADFLPGGRVVPLAFKRTTQEVFTVSRVNSSWEDTEPEHRLLYFSVTTDKSDDAYQLRYQDEDRTWWLECVMMEG
ncbi:MAG: hypothetical protein ACODAJ_03005 [Planctomycetota bacterium]